MGHTIPPLPQSNSSINSWNSGIVVCFIVSLNLSVRRFVLAQRRLCHGRASLPGHLGRTSRLQRNPRLADDDLRPLASHRLRRSAEGRSTASPVVCLKREFMTLTLCHVWHLPVSTAEHVEFVVSCTNVMFLVIKVMFIAGFDLFYDCQILWLSVTLEAFNTDNNLMNFFFVKFWILVMSNVLVVLRVFY